MSRKDIEPAFFFDHAHPDHLWFTRYIGQFKGNVHAAVARLGLIGDSQAVETITINIFHDLWQDREALMLSERPGTILFKTLLLHVFTYLQREGKEDRVRDLRNVLPCHPQF